MMHHAMLVWGFSTDIVLCGDWPSPAIKWPQWGQVLMVEATKPPHSGQVRADIISNLMVNTSTKVEKKEQNEKRDVSF